MPTEDQPPFGKRSTASAGGFADMVRDITDLPAAGQVPDALRGLPQYTDFKELGRGGMGVVYLARNTLLDRLEVLKVAQIGAGRERFLREMRAAAKLQHPNVVTAYSADERGDTLVFAMEYVTGEDLQKVVARKGRLPVPTACFYAYCAARGIQHAHDHKLVHRDIKPANLLLTVVSGKQVVKVADFGLAKPAAADDGLTGGGRLMGTPDYFAPEQAADATAADTRADIYSLGCTLYCLLTASPPFKHVHGLVGKVEAHRSEPPKLLTEVRPDIPPELAVVVAKMLAKRPEDRFQSPGDVASALKRFVRPEAKSAESAVPRKAVLPRLWLAVVTAFVVLAAGGAWVMSRGRMVESGGNTQSAITTPRTPESAQPELAAKKMTTPVQQPSQPAARFDAVVMIPPTTEMGHVTGRVAAGEVVSLEYKSGAWNHYGTIASTSPDAIELGPRIHFSRLAVCELVGKRTQVLVVVPGGTTNKPFRWTADKDYDQLVLRINDNDGNYASNPGVGVYYRLQLFPAAVAPDPQRAADSKPPSQMLSVAAALSDQLTVGSVWKGTTAIVGGQRKGSTSEKELHIQRRDGGKFIGLLRGKLSEGGRTIHAVEGELSGSTIRWKETASGGKVVFRERVGTFDGKTIDLSVVAEHEGVKNESSLVLRRQDSVTGTPP